MSTDFLNRRMDLHHSVSGTISNLTMDTSYPVRLAGKVIKLFTASHFWDVNCTYWTIVNTEETEILHVLIDKVFDFAGRIINNNIGEGLAYPTAGDVFKTDDYVMVIIDFDNESLHLCSETNFSKFITGGGDGDGNLKLFVIDGNDTENGFDFKIDRNIFDAASEFESKEDKHSLMRHSQDQVVYECPDTISVIDTDGNEIGKERSMIPVAKVSTIDINKLNTSVQTLMFPYSIKGGYDSAENLAAFAIVNGTLNSKFIKEFCFSQSDLEQLDIFKNAPGDELLSEYNNIENKDEYYYVLAGKVPNTNDDVDGFNQDKLELTRFDDNLWFIPIRKSDNRFASYFEISNKSISINGENVYWYLGLDPEWNPWIGSFKSDRDVSTFVIYHYEDGGSGIRIFDGIGNEGYSQTKHNDYLLWLRNKDRDSNYYWCYYGGEHQNYNEPENTNIKKLINFFCIDNDPYCNNIKRIAMSTKSSTNRQVHLLRDENGLNINKNPMCVVFEYPEIFEDNIFNDEEQNLKNYTPIGMEDESEEVKAEYRKSQIFKNRISQNNNSIDEQIVYTVFSTNETSGRIEDTGNIKQKDGTIYSNGIMKTIDIGMGFDENNKEIFSPVGFNFKANRSMTNIKEAEGLCIQEYSVKDSQDKQLRTQYVMTSYINKASVASINRYDKSSPEYNDILNNSEITINSMMVYKEIDLAKDRIEITDNGDMHIKAKVDYKLSDVIKPLLYIILPAGINESPGEGEYVYTNRNGKRFIYKRANINSINNFKDVNIDGFGNYMYLYYHHNGLHRVKYYYDDSVTDSNGIVISRTDIANNYHYISDSNVISSDKTTDIDIINTKQEYVYLKAIVNYLSRMSWDNSYDGNFEPFGFKIPKFSTTKNVLDLIHDYYYASLVNLAPQIALIVASEYCLFPEALPSNTGNYVRAKIFKSDSLSATTTYNLSVGIDEKIAYAGTEPGIDGKGGYTLKNLMGDAFYYTIHHNMGAPYLSDTKNADNALVYNKKTYVDYIKNNKLKWINNDYMMYHMNGLQVTSSFNSAFDWYKATLTTDLFGHKKPNSNFPIVESENILLFKKEDVSKIIIFPQIEQIYYGESDGPFSLNINYTFINSNDGSAVLTSLVNSLSLHFNINSDNLFGFNQSVLNDVNGEDVTSLYTTTDPYYINLIETGKREAYSVSLNDLPDNEFKTSLLPLNGNEDVIESSNIIWSNLLDAVSNNKSIDILSNSLKKIKEELNVYFLNDTQNVNDNVPVENNLTDEVTKDFIDKVNHTSQSADESGHFTIMDETVDPPVRKDVYKQYDRDRKAEWDPVHNIYKYYFGYGYEGKGPEKTGKTNERQLNNRGVIVFVTEGGTSRTLYGNGDVRDDIRSESSKIIPKRMYVSPEGIVCNKEYYDESTGVGVYDPLTNTTTYKMSTEKKTESICKILNDINESLIDIRDYIKGDLNNSQTGVSLSSKIIDITKELEKLDDIVIEEE